MTKASSFILRLYFAVVAAVTLFTLMFGSVQLLDIGLKTYIFTAADRPSYLEDCSNPDNIRAPIAVGEYRELKPVSDEEVSAREEEIRQKCESRNASSLINYQQNKASDAVRSLAMILVSIPLFIIHFKILYRDWKEEREKSKK